MASIRKISESTYIFLNIQDNTLDDMDDSSRLNDQFQFSPPRYGLGALDTLPLEIIHLTLIRLDIQSLTDFRRVNKRARLVTNSIPQYNRIITHVPASIRGSLNIGSARFFSCQDLYERLSTAECDSCGDFGGYLYLVTCRRVCFLCFTENPEYCPLTRPEAIRKFGLETKHLTSLPCIKSFPGRYSPRNLKRPRREALFDYSAVQQKGIDIHGTITSMEEYVSEMMSKRLKAYNSKLSVRRIGERNPRPPRSEDPFDGGCSNPRRFMGVILAPYFNARTGSTEWGLHCLACKSHHYCRPLHWRRKYTIDSFQDHIGECGEIAEGKHTPL